MALGVATIIADTTAAAAAAAVAAVAAAATPAEAIAAAAAYLSSVSLDKSLQFFNNLINKMLQFLNGFQQSD